jgi:hypothetical protein
MSDFPIQPQNRQLSGYTLESVLDLFGKNLLLGTNCHAIAKVQSFNPAPGAPGLGSRSPTITATINYQKSYQQPNEKGVYGIVGRNYPIMVDVPVYVYGGGTAALKMPIAVGDDCLICFNDRDIDAWLTTGNVTQVGTARLHSFTDGIALVGLRPFTKPYATWSSTDAELANGTTKVGVGPHKITIANNSTSLNPLLQSLITDLQTLITQLTLLTVTCASPGNPSSVPINAAAIGAVSTSLSTLATSISGLLQ